MDNKVRIRAELENAVSKGLRGIRSDFDDLAKSKGAQTFLGGVGMGIGQAAWNALGGAVDQVTDFLGDSVRAASELNETQSKAAVIFGSSAGALEDWASRGAQAFGMSKRAALEAASTYGDLFRNVGQSADTAATMSQRLVELAGDLASFSNLDPGDVLQKLQSGLAGESEPLRRLGVFLSDAKVKAKAMQLGLGDAHGELTEGEKILARYQIILDETTRAQGDFARTANGLANSQRTTNAELENAKANLGEAFQPFEIAWTKAQADWWRFVSSGIDGWRMLAEKISNNPIEDHVYRATDNVRGLGAALVGAGVAATVTRVPIADMIPEFEGLAASAADAKVTTDGLVSSLVDGLFGSAVNAGRRQELTDRIADLRKELGKTTDKGDARILRGQIAELEGQLLELDLVIASSKGPQAAMDTLTTWRTKTGKLTDAQQALYDKLWLVYKRALLLSSVVFPSGLTYTGVGGSVRGQATGGHIGPGWEGWVGEGGAPEYLRMDGSGGATVYSGGAKAAAGSGGSGAYAPVEIPVVLDGREIARVVDDRLYLALAGATGARR